MGFARIVITFNRRLSRSLDRLLPEALRTDGHDYFRDEIVPSALIPGQKVYDFGGGSRPFVGHDLKASLNLTVIGVDIDRGELNRAPSGVYDEIIVGDICHIVGSSDADLIICQATLEHVCDTAGALRAIASFLKPGGVALVFAPSRNAAFAFLNRHIPERVKRRLLFALFPEKAMGHDGFPAFYDRCTPHEVARMAEDNGLVVESRRLFWISSYFSIFAPAYVLWRAWQGLFYLINRDQAAETFAFTFRRPETALAGSASSIPQAATRPAA